MLALRFSPRAWAIGAAGVMLASLWPLTAYSVGPVVLPGALAIGVVAIVVAYRPEYGIALGLALSPWTNFEIGGERPFRFLLPALAAGLLLYGMLVSRREDRLPTHRSAGAVFLFAVVALASSLQALEPAESLTKLFGLLTAVALFFAVLTICREPRQLIIVASGAVAGVLLASAEGVFQQVTGDFSELGFVADGEVVERVQGSFGHPNQYAGFIAVLFPIAVALFLTGSLPARVRWLAALSLALALPALTFAYTRGAIIGLVLGALIWLGFVRPRAAVIVAVLVTLAGAAVIPGVLKERLSESTGGDVELRSDLWGSALDIYSQRPILGVGLHNFEQGYSRLSSTLANASQRRLLHQSQVLTPPHAANLYLNILAEEGLIGLLAFAVFAGMAVAVAYRASRVSDPAGRSIGIGLGVGLMALGVHSLFEVTLFSELSQPFLALLAVAAVYVALEKSKLMRGGEPASTAASGSA